MTTQRYTVVTLIRTCDVCKKTSGSTRAVAQPGQVTAMGDLLHVYGDDPDGPGWGKIEAFGGTPLGDVCPSCVVEQSQKLYPGLPETNDPAKGRRS